MVSLRSTRSRVPSRTAAKRTLRYDVLVVATGARALTVVPGALTFRGPRDADAMRAVADAVRAGSLGSVAFVVPPGTAWSLPLYELALGTAVQGRKGDQTRDSPSSRLSPLLSRPSGPKPPTRSVSCSQSAA